jgi:hypothetical protein
MGIVVMVIACFGGRVTKARHERRWSGGEGVNKNDVDVG